MAAVDTASSSADMQARMEKMQMESQMFNLKATETSTAVNNHSTAMHTITAANQASSEVGKQVANGMVSVARAS